MDSDSTDLALSITTGVTLVLFALACVFGSCYHRQRQKIKYSRSAENLVEIVNV